mmetsp:Transcript_45638/g.108658  ORF Transcript_45638/g.108658 Transcript_45638/m.108658 type:complete len:92 (-) Transcript_45638:353-628(-)
MRATYIAQDVLQLLIKDSLGPWSFDTSNIWRRTPAAFATEMARKSIPSRPLTVVLVVANLIYTPAGSITPADSVPNASTDVPTAELMGQQS